MKANDRQRKLTTPVFIEGEASGPTKHIRSDPRPNESGNVIKFIPKEQGHGLDRFSGNIPFGIDAIAAFERAVRERKFDGVPIRACALIVGGTRDVNSRSGGLHGGTTVAEWDERTGLRAPRDWRERVRQLPRPKVLPATGAVGVMSQ